jgi:hypothetical protein
MFFLFIYSEQLWARPLNTDYYKTLYDLCELIKQDNSQRYNYEQEFFRLFPKDFKELETKYGYNNIKSQTKEWDYALIHINQLFDL